MPINKKSLFICILSFFIPTFILVFVLYKLEIAPFGDKSLLIMDMSNQYVEFFAGLRNNLREGKSLLYSWSMGFGANMIGLFAYYLASPLSLILVFFNDSVFPAGITLLTLIKIGLCGLSFSIFLIRKFEKPRYIIAVFSSFYALSAFNVGYSMCIMWIDAVFWLPLLILALEKLVFEKKFAAFSLVLFAVIISNYYMAYITGGFCFLYFLYLFFSKQFTGFFKNFGRFIAASALSAGMSAFLIFPTIFCMTSGKLAGGGYVSDSTIAFNPFVLIPKLMAGNSYDLITYTGTPFVYAGIPTLILLFAFFASKGIKLREKLVSAAFLAVFLLSFVFTKLDIIWHVFQSPNWFPFRYAFLLSFLVLFFGYKAYAQTEKNSYFPFAAAGCAVLFIFAASGYYFEVSTKTVLLNLGLAVSYAAGFILFKSGKKILSKAAATAFLILCVFELGFNTQYIYKALDSDFGYDLASEYTDFKKDINPLIRLVKSKDSSFYRMEKTFERSKNDSFGSGYNGIGHYSSAYDRNVNSMLYRLGFAQDYFWCSYLGSTPLTDSLFGIKYIMSEYSPFEDYVKLGENNGIGIYQNPWALPLVFAANKDVLSYTEYLDSFLNQNLFLSGLTGVQENFFTPAEGLMMETENISYNAYEGRYEFSKNSTEEDGIITYYFTADKSGPVYAYFPSENKNRVLAHLYVNGEFKEYLFTSDTDRILYLGNFKEGERVETQILLKDDYLTLNGCYIYILDSKKLESTLESLKSNSLEISNFSDSKITGKINITSEKGLMFTTIRADDGWNLYVDGKKTEYTKFNDTFICAELAAGTHDIALKFLPRGLYPGIAISLLCAAAVIFFFYKEIKKCRKN